MEYQIIGNGKTTLVVETGIGNLYDEWLPLTEGTAEEFTWFLYHRKGYGMSDAPTRSRTTEHIADELHDLLHACGIEKDYVLVGHSFGGLCAQQYAKRFGSELAAVVLLDATSTHASQLDQLDTPTIIEQCSIDKMIAYCQTAANEGKDVKRHLAMVDEFQNWESSGAAIRQMDVALSLPVRVLARDIDHAVANWVKHGIPKQEAEIHEAAWRDYQMDLLQLSSDSQLWVAENSDHMIHLDRPDIVLSCLRTLKAPSSVFGDKKPNHTYTKRPGAYALILNDTGKLAVVKIPWGYMLPGGGLESGETVEDTLRRECQEEIGYVVRPEKAIATYGQYTFGKKQAAWYELIGHFYQCTLVEWTGIGCEPDHELVWLEPEEAIESMTLEYQAEAIRTLLASQ